MTDREHLCAKVRALMAKTVENGCTEDEAVAAAAKAAEMLARYNLTLDEVQARQTPFERMQARFGDEAGARLWKPAAAISELTGAVFWRSPAGVHPVELTFFGFAHEVDVAKYLLAICARAMRQAEARLNADWALVTPAARRRRVLPFLDGMADRLHRRILDLKPPRVPGTGLVVVRGDLIRRAMKDAGIKLRTSNVRPSRDGESSYQDGVRAADRVALSQGVGWRRDSISLR